MAILADNLSGHRACKSNDFSLPLTFPLPSSRDAECSLKSADYFITITRRSHSSRVASATTASTPFAKSRFRFARKTSAPMRFTISWIDGFSGITRASDKTGLRRDQDQASQTVVVVAVADEKGEKSSFHRMTRITVVVSTTAQASRRSCVHQADAADCNWVDTTRRDARTLGQTSARRNSRVERPFRRCQPLVSPVRCVQVGN